MIFTMVAYWRSVRTSSSRNDHLLQIDIQLQVGPPSLSNPFCPFRRPFPTRLRLFTRHPPHRGVAFSDRGTPGSNAADRVAQTVRFAFPGGVNEAARAWSSILFSPVTATKVYFQSLLGPGFITNCGSMIRKKD